MTRFAAGLALLLAAGACDQQERTEGGPESSTTAADAPAPPAGERATTDHAAEGHGAAEGGQALLPIMQRLGAEMTTLTYALMTDDYSRVETSAQAIAEHAPISIEEVERIHAILGAEMARFEAVDESVHVASVRLHEAARAREPGAVIERLGEVQRGCVSCHAQFRDRLVTSRSGPF